MEHDFWHDRWEEGRIGFHEGRPNGLLVAHFPVLGLVGGARVFLPLCGKTRDISWLVSQGYQVAGVELSERAIVQLFEELGIRPTVTGAGPLKRYSAPDIDIFVGDVFALTREVLGPVSAIFDRAALVALPDGMRCDYAGHLVAVTGAALQLLICFEYDQRKMQGPPFSIENDEVQRLYANTYEVRLIERTEAAGGLKGIAATEAVWLLQPR